MLYLHNELERLLHKNMIIHKAYTLLQNKHLFEGLLFQNEIKRILRTF